MINLTKKEKQMRELANKMLAEGKALRSKVGVEVKDIKDVLKKRICSFFVKYKKRAGITNTQLSSILDIGEEDVMRILAYHIDHFSLDELVDLLEKAQRSDSSISKDEILKTS